MSLFVTGCGSNSAQIHAVNNSGQRLEHVRVSANGKSFEFGVLINGGTAGFMTADRLFGRKFPKNSSMQFETTEGESFDAKINFKNKPTRKLTVTIDSKFNASGKFD